jgi:hypothetical protein
VPGGTGQSTTLVTSTITVIGSTEVNASIILFFKT